MNTTQNPNHTGTTLEDFTFADGTVALAWVTWEFLPSGERRCISVRRIAGSL